MTLTSKEKKNFILNALLRLERESVLDKRIHPDYKEREKEVKKIKDLILKLQTNKPLTEEEETYIKNEMQKVR